MLTLMPLTLLSTCPPPPSLPHLSHHKNPIKPLTNSISLLRYHAQDGRMRDARNVFDGIPDRTPVSWTILMDGYARHGPAVESLLLLCDMMDELSIDSFVISVGLKACAALGSLDCGSALHCSAVKLGYMEELFVANALVTMYSACGFLCYAESVFERISQPDLVSWSSILSGLVKNGKVDEAVELFVKMTRKGIGFDSYVLSIGMKAFQDRNCVSLGIQVHCYLIKAGLNSSFLYNSLMEFYGRIGDLASMRKAFRKMLRKDLVSWNTFISCHARSVCCEDALMYFSQLMLEGSCECDDFTLGSTLQAVTRLGALNHGKQIHGYVIRAGFESNSYVMSALLDMYIKSSCQDTISFKLLRHFWSFEVEPDEFIVASILKCCALHQDLEVGRMFHSFILKVGMELDAFVISSLIDMYAKCGVLDACLRVFVGIQNLGTVPWSAIIAAYCWNFEYQEALYLFRKMQLAGVRANEFTYTSAILACVALGDLKTGIEIHGNVIRCGYNLNASVVNTLISLYLEFSQFQGGLKLSSSIPSEEISWDTLIQAFGKAEEHERTLKVFHKIQQNYWHLDHKSASFVLNSCGTLVLLDAGIQAHAYITKRGLLTDLKMNNALINMYSKCGALEHAVEAFNQLPEKNSASWTSIISAHVDHDHPSEAISQFVKMIRKGKSPDCSTFLSVLKACGQMGLIDEAFRLFTSMIEVYKINPSAEVYSSMVEVLSCAGMFREAEHFIETVIPFKTASSVWRTLLCSCQNHGNVRVAKVAAEKLVELEPSDFGTNLLLEQVLQSENWNVASEFEFKSLKSGSSWIESRGNIIEFALGQTIIGQFSSKLMEVGRKMEESGYVTYNYNSLHTLEEYKEMSSQHTELLAIAYGLVCLPQGIPIRVVKITRMSVDCHTACKFISTFVRRDIVIKDSCKFHRFKDGRCSCKDKW